MFEFEVHRGFLAICVFSPQRQERAEEPRRAGGVRGSDDGDVVGVEFFDFEVVEDACGFFQGGGKDGGEEFFCFSAVEFAVGERFGSGGVGYWAD